MTNGYTVEDKIRAVRTLQRFGGLTTDGVAAARQLLGSSNLSKSTLHGWLKLYSSAIEPNSEPIAEPYRTAKKEPDPQTVADIVSKADDDLAQMFEDTARIYLERASDPSAIADTKGKDAVMTAAIAIDKMRVLRGLPTEIIQVLPLIDEVSKKLAKHGKSFTELMTQIASRLPDEGEVLQ